jgi:glycine/D-amino acid oxidase-like deaminating enzyme
MAKIVIVGGGVIGSSTAYYLALAGHAADTVVVEPDPTYEFAATPRATGGIRQLFTVPENIRMSQYGHEIYGRFETLMEVDGDPAPIDFHRDGYLWLGSARAKTTSMHSSQTGASRRRTVLVSNCSTARASSTGFRRCGSTISTSPRFRPMTATWTRTAC